MLDDGVQSTGAELEVVDVATLLVEAIEVATVTRRLGDLADHPAGVSDAQVTRRQIAS